jgi:transcription elongation factor Elf1
MKTKQVKKMRKCTICGHSESVHKKNYLGLLNCRSCERAGLENFCDRPDTRPFFKFKKVI